MRENEIPVNKRDDGKYEILLGRMVHVITDSQAVEMANKILKAMPEESDIEKRSKKPRGFRLRFKKEDLFCDRCGKSVCVDCSKVFLHYKGYEYFNQEIPIKRYCLECYDLMRRSHD